jgi:pyruvate dehydrogenase E2 component (dihydrolipoamide acetyltransferase)
VSPAVDVAEVRVKEGDVIESGAVVCEVETDKAVAEINCPHAGKVTKVLIKTGDKITVGQPIMLIEAASGTAAPAAKPTPPAAAAPTPAATATAPSQPAKPVAAVASGPVEFKLPEVSEGVTKVDVASINVKVGDAISKGDVVCEVETDKAVAEITCPHTGTIAAVHVTPGMSITIGTPLLTINTTSAAATPAAKPAPAPAPAPATATAPTAVVSDSNRRSCSSSQRSFNCTNFNGCYDTKERWSSGSGGPGRSAICS